MEYVMGIDLGTSSVKAVLMNRNGIVTAAAAQEYEVLVPDMGYAVQDPEQWWRKTRQAVAQVLSLGKIAAEDVKGIGFSGQMHGLVALDKAGKPVIPTVIWMDQRAQAQQKKITKLVREQGLERELMNKPLAGMLICSLLWVKENQPDIYGRIAHVLLPKDYIRYRLGGGFDTDETDAGGSLAFSVRDRRWCRELLDSLGIPVEIFPGVRKPYEIVGAVTEEAARETGLKAGTVLAAGGADSAMQLTGNGIVKEECLCCNIGTASQILTVSKKPLYDEKLRTQTLCHSVPGLWYLQCGSLNGGSTLGWLKKRILKTEKSYEQLDGEAGKVSPGCDGLLFLPYLAGERVPYENSHAKGVFFGLSMETEQAHMVRAVMEGVAVNLGLCYKVFCELGLGGKEYLVVSGGGAKGKTWRQILADVFNLPVYRTRSVQEACTGAALMAAVALGWYPSVEEGAARVAGLEWEPVMPVAEHVRVYEEIGGRLAGLYQVTKSFTMI